MEGDTISNDEVKELCLKGVLIERCCLLVLIRRLDRRSIVCLALLARLLELAGLPIVVVDRFQVLKSAVRSVGCVVYSLFE